MGTNVSILNSFLHYKKYLFSFRCNTQYTALYKEANMVQMVWCLNYKLCTPHQQNQECLNHRNHKYKMSVKRLNTKTKPRPNTKI